MLNRPAFELLRWFGRESIPPLASRYPDFFDAHASTRPFVLNVNNIIHPEVHKLYPGADVPTFGFHDELDGSLLMTYVSARRLCALAQGLIEGAAEYFKERISFDHLQCIHGGDPHCLFRITFHGRRAH
ncbi:heme-NO-binding protein [compost metagenome]